MVGSCFKDAMQDGSVDFYRGWSDYTNGFGDLNGEFWLGLDKLHRLTKVPQLLRVDLGDFDGNKKYAKFTEFIVGNATSNYTLTYSQNSGDAGNALGYHRGMQFTTRDRDNDLYANNCAVKYRGAWWYNNCYHSNLNGIYINNGTSTDKQGLRWIGWKNNVIKFTEMKLRLV